MNIPASFVNIIMVRMYFTTNYANISKAPDSRTFPFWHSLDDSCCMILSRTLKKRHLLVLIIKLTLLDILIEFCISANYYFSQIALLVVCTEGFLNMNYI